VLLPPLASRLRRGIGLRQSRGRSQGDENRSPDTEPRP